MNYKSLVRARVFVDFAFSFSTIQIASLPLFVPVSDFVKHIGF